MNLKRYGALSDKSYNELEELGLPKGLVDSWFEGQSYRYCYYIDVSTPNNRWYKDNESWLGK